MDINKRSRGELKVYFKKNANDAGESALFISRETGNVGIGTIDPKSKLSVSGSFGHRVNESPCQ